MNCNLDFLAETKAISDMDSIPFIRIKTTIISSSMNFSALMNVKLENILMLQNWNRRL